MVGLAQASVYVGPVALDADVVAGLDGRGPRRVAAADEDALALGLAALDGLGEGTPPEALLACVPGGGLSTRGLAAAAAATDAVPRDLPCLGVAWESGAAAGLLGAASRLRRGSSVVLAVDCGETEGEVAAPVGDLAVALRLGQPEIADILSWMDVTDLTFDHWVDERGGLHVADARFVEHAVVSGAGRKLLDGLRKDGDVPSDEPVRTVAVTAGGRPVPRVERNLSDGIPGEDLPPWAGAPGRMVAGALYLLLHELAAVEAGELVALLDLGYGGGAMLLRAGPQARQVAASLPLGSGTARPLSWYLHTRGLLPNQRAEPTISPPELWRDMGGLLSLQGRHCPSCNLTMYPPGVVCEGCGERDTESVPLQRTGVVLTETVDQLFPSGGGAAVQMVAVELDGGGRFYGQAVEEAAPLGVGDRCRLVLRRLHRGGGLPHYFWKVMPDGN